LGGTEAVEPTAAALQIVGSILMGEAKPTILVVEDDALLRMHAADLLEENGFGVVEAASADAALNC
jgi:hypothetical protein